MSNAPRNTNTRPKKYIKGEIQLDSGKNRPASRAMTGIFAPQGMNGVSIAVALRSLSSRMVRQAMTPGMAQPVPTTRGMMDLPDRPTLLKMGSSTTETRAMYPQSSSRDSRKYITMTSGRKPMTAPTPPIMPSTMIVCKMGAVLTSKPLTHSPNISIKVTRPGSARPDSNS